MSDNITLTPWYLVRHAPVKEVRKGIYNDADSGVLLPLVAEIRRLADRLPEDALWFVSPLLRARQTAEALWSESNKPGDVFYVEALREQSFGDWQGLSFEEVWREIKGLPAHNWSLLAAETRPPNGESFQDVRARVAKFLVKNKAIEPKRPRVLVTHAGVIRAMIGVALEMESNQAQSFGVDTFSVSLLLQQTGRGKGGAWRLDSLNRTYEKDDRHEKPA